MFFRFAPMGKVEKTRFEQNYTTFVNPALCVAWKSPPKMVVWNRNCKIRFPGCFFRFAPMGKVEKTPFEQNYTTFVNPALCAAWKSPPKMVVWNRNCKIRFPGCFFFLFRPDGESRKNAFWTKLYDLRQPGFMRCLEKPTQNGGMKPQL